MRVRVYRHLRRLVWSIQDPRTGLVVDHRPELVLVGVALVVSEATRQRVVQAMRWADYHPGYAAFAEAVMDMPSEAPTPPPLADAG